MGTKRQPTELSNTIGQLIKRRRIEKGLSIYKLAFLVDGHTTNRIRFSAYEQGTKTPDIEHLNKILISLDLNLVDIFKNL